jgi:flagellar hook-length control protein FliK
VERATAKDPAQPAKNDAQDSGDKHADSKQPGDKPAAKPGDSAAPAQAPAQTRPAVSAKASGKPDKNKDDDTSDTANEASDQQQVAAIEQQMSDQQALPPAPVAPMPIAAPAITGTDAGTDIQIDAASPKTVPASCNTDLPLADSMPVPAGPQAAATTPAAPQPSLAAQPDDSQVEDSETPATTPPAAVQTAPVDTKPLVASKDSKDSKPAAVKATAKSDPAVTAKPQAAVESVQVDSAEPAAISTVKDSDDRIRDAAPVKVAKEDDVNDVALKSRSTHAGVAGDNSVKADTSAPDVQKAAAPQQDARPLDTATAPDAAKPTPAPQSASVSNAMFAINTIAAPQAALHSQAPTATQHVQVTAQAEPNLPALAVEISAKSQSGAKQFDIRLDPPELGRVEVRLSIDATGKASAHLSADQPQTLGLLQKDAPILMRALREAGLDVSQDGLNFSLRQQAQGQGGNQGGNDGNNGRFGGTRAFPLTATASIDPTAIAYRGVIDGRLDIRV